MPLKETFATGGSHKKPKKPRFPWRPVIALCIVLFVMGVFEMIVMQDTVSMPRERGDISRMPQTDNLKTMNQMVKRVVDYSNARPACIINPSSLSKRKSYRKPAVSTLQRFDPSRYDEIYFYHVRKTGGSTLRYYLTRVAKHYGINFTVAEGARAANPAHERRLLGKRRFFVTMLRDPVQRSLSHYKYSFRWNCRLLSDKQSPLIPTLENSNSLDSWMSLTDHCQEIVRLNRDPIQVNRCKEKLWDCSLNCLLKWFTNLSLTTDFEKAYKESTEIIRSYDLVLQTKYLADAKYVEQVEKFFNVSKLEKKRSFCSIEARAANDKVPLVLTKKQAIDLRVENLWDTKFYVDATTCD